MSDEWLKLRCVACGRGRVVAATPNERSWPYGYEPPTWLMEMVAETIVNLHGLLRDGAAALYGDSIETELIALAHRAMIEATQRTLLDDTCAKGHAMRPIGDRVIVKPDELEKQIGSIFIPDSAQKNTLRGTVVAVGSGRTTDDGRVMPMTVKIGDTVYYDFFGVEIDYYGERCLCLRESDLLAIVD